MSRFDKKVLVVIGIAVATLGQAAAAGVAHLLDRGAAEQIVVERANVLQRQQELVRAKEREIPEVPQPGSGWRLLETADVASTMQVLQGIADVAGVTFDSVKAAPTNSPGKQPFQIVGHGTPLQVCEFLAGIEQDTRLIVIESGRILPASDTEIAFELGLATHHTGGAR